jgi:hypothetical protein
MSAEPLDALLFSDCVLHIIISMPPEPPDDVLFKDRVLPIMGPEPFDVELLSDVVCAAIGWLSPPL